MSAIPTPVGYHVLQAPDTSTDTVLGATERLKFSRQKMRDQMLALNASSAQAQAAKQGPGHSSALMATLTALPVIGPLIHSAASWWADHPLHAVADLFTPRKDAAAEPASQTLTQRHPWAMLVSAAAIGALLMWARPWRYALLRRAVYSGVLPQVFTSLLSRVSTDGLLDLANSMLRRPAAASARNASTPPAVPQPDGSAGTTPNSTLH